MTYLKKTLISSILILSLLVPHAVMADEDDKPSIQKTIDWAVRICHDQSYGYSQEHRWGDGGYDCSSFVISAFWAGGFHLGYKDKYEGCTADIKRAFMEAGFDWYPASDLNLDKGTIDLLLPGDVLLIDGYHAELYIGDGLTAAAHEDVPSKDHPNRSKEPGDQGDEVCVYEYVYHPWTGVLRYNAENDVIFRSQESESEEAGGSERHSGNDDNSESEHVSESDSYSESEGDSESKDVSESDSHSESEGDSESKDVSESESYSESQEDSEDNDDSESESQEESEGEGESSDSADPVPDTSLPALFRVVADALFVRQGPGTDTPAVEYLQEDEQVIVTDLTGVWGHVTVCGVKGYVNMMYMNRVRRVTSDELPDSTPSDSGSESSAAGTGTAGSGENTGTQSPSDALKEVPDRILTEVIRLFYTVPTYPAGQVLTVNTDTLLVRREPGSKDDPIYALNEYDRVEILEQTGSWGKIKVGDIYGWIDLHYCRE